MLYGQTQRNITSRFIKEAGRELVEKHDNTTLANNKDEGITAMQSASLQQQLARNRMLQKSASIKTPTEYFEGEKISHNIFGEGVIISVKKMANDALLEIAFENGWH